MRLLVLLTLALTFSCAHKPVQTGKVIIIKQWHPSPSVDTRNIQASKSIPQYQNQKDIYDYLSNRVKTQKANLLIVEGCESGKEIDESFQQSFNGWNMASLSKASSSGDYEDIVTALPLKLKAKFPKEVTALCADNESLLKKNQLAISDARGFIGFYVRLKQNTADPKKFLTYKKALEETQKIEVADPIGYSKSQTIKSLENFNHYMQQRNALFARAIKKHLNENPILIVGGLHAKDLVNQLKAEGIETEVITPKGYPESSEKLAEDLMKELEQ
jgi:hypothetical protein